MATFPISFFKLTDNTASGDKNNILDTFYIDLDYVECI